jgi:hypothetical protein
LNPDWKPVLNPVLYDVASIAAATAAPREECQVVAVAPLPDPELNPELNALLYAELNPLGNPDWNPEL